MDNNAKGGKKILVIEVIEDEQSLRNALRDKLVREGFVMLEAENGEEGLAIALREHPDLILLDIIMPKMDGITMMKKLRSENEWGKQVPIILLTNLSADDEKINQAITENEPAYYLVKSNWTINDLIDKIRERLSRPKQ
jgi:two-component system response regulator MprA